MCGARDGGRGRDSAWTRPWSWALQCGWSGDGPGTPARGQADPRPPGVGKDPGGQAAQADGQGHLVHHTRRQLRVSTTFSNPSRGNSP